MLPSCTTTAKPYIIGLYDRVGTYAATAASTPGEACQLFAAQVGQTITAVTTNACNITGAAGYSYPILQLCEIDPGVISPERLQDLMAIFYIAIPFLIAVFGGKKLLNLFDRDHEKA